MGFLMGERVGGTEKKAALKEDLINGHASNSEPQTTKLLFKLYFSREKQITASPDTVKFRIF